MSISELPSILNSISQPYDFPIQFFCITFTLFGQLFKLSKPFKSSSENLDILNELEKVIIIEESQIKNKSTLLQNQIFMLTGKLNGISRAEAKSLIEENSGTIVSSISKKLNYLVVGEKPTKRKIEFAQKLKIEILDQDQFFKMLNKTR